MKSSLILLPLLGLLAICQADAVRLQIKGPDGKPVAGAKVQVHELKIVTTAAVEPDFLAPLSLTSDTTGVVSFESKTPMQQSAEKGKKTIRGSWAAAVISSPGLATGMTWLVGGTNTFALQKAQTYEGVALDSEQRPIAGVRLRAILLSGGGIDSFLQRIPLPQSITDAQGRFRFDAVPNKGKVSIEVNDPKWKHETFAVELGLKAPPIFLTPGGVVKGRLLKPDGTPAAGVRLANGGLRGPVTTRADGRFEITGLGEENVYLEVIGSNQKMSFVVEPKIVTRLQAGEIRKIGDWKAVRGVHAQGKVIAEDTKKPVANASIMLWGPGNSGGKTNAQGTFDIVMSRESNMMSVQADGFVAVQKPIAATPRDGVMSLSTIELRRGKTVSGILLDDKGNAIPKSFLKARKKNGDMNDGETFTNDEGRFSFSGLGPGTYTVQVPGFKVTGGAQFSVGEQTNTSSLRVVTSAAPRPSSSLAAFTEQNISGRIETTDGEGIGGAKIAFRLVNGDGSYQEGQALSQSDGSFSSGPYMGFRALGGQIKVAQVVRPGFGASTNTTTFEKGNWKVAIKMQPKGTMLRGRIVNAQGHGVNHAFVALRDGVGRPVAADENGNFAMPDAPLQGVTLLASNGPSFTSFEVKEAEQKVEIILPDAPAPGDKVALADTLLQDASFGWKWKENWDDLGMKRIETVITHNGIGDAESDWSWGQYLEEIAEREPKTFLAREAELRAASANSNAPLFERLLMRSRASDGSDEQKAQVRAWLSDEEKKRRDISSDTVAGLLQLAEIAARLDPQLGASWLDYAAQIADQLPDNGNEVAWQSGKLIARTQKNAPLPFVDGWKPTPALQLLGGAMSVYLETSDLEDARLAYAQSEKVAKQAAAISETDIKAKPYAATPEVLRSRTAALYASLLSRTDPKAALVIVPSLRDYEQTQALGAIAREAVRLGQTDVAKQAIEATFAVPFSNTDFIVEAAKTAQELEPDFANKTWARAYDRSHLSGADAERMAHLSFADYAAARAQNWPGESRILIEREWQKRLEQAPGEDPENGAWNASGIPGDLVVAMARVSPARALEMLPSVTQNRNLRAQTRARMAASLLSK